VLLGASDFLEVTILADLIVDERDGETEDRREEEDSLDSIGRGVGDGRPGLLEKIGRWGRWNSPSKFGKSISMSTETCLFSRPSSSLALPTLSYVAPDEPLSL